MENTEQKWHELGKIATLSRSWSAMRRRSNDLLELLDPTDGFKFPVDTVEAERLLDQFVSNAHLLIDAAKANQQTPQQ